MYHKTKFIKFTKERFIDTIMRIGYARVSTKEQNLNLQIEALEKAGCEIIFRETISGATKVRPELDKMIAQFRKGDELVVIIPNKVHHIPRHSAPVWFWL